MSFRIIRVMLILALVVLSSCESMGPHIPKRLPIEPLGEAAIEQKLRDEPKDAVDSAAIEAEPEMLEPEIYSGTGIFIKDKYKSPTKTTPRQGKYTLNFDDADLGEVTKVVLGDTLNENYVLSPKVAGRVTLQTSRPLTREELIPTLEMLLQMNGAVLIQDEGVYRIEPAAKALHGVRASSLARPGQSLSPGFQIRIVPLRYIAALEMQKILEPLLSPPKGMVRVDPLRNLLMISGTAQQLEHTLETIDVFDIDWMKGLSVGLFPIANVEIATLIAELEQLFGAALDGPLAGIFRLLPIERLNSILVVTQQPRYLDAVRHWITRLDRSQSEGGASGGVHVYRVQNVDAVELAAQLNDIFGGKKKTVTRSASLAPGLKPKTVKGKKKDKGKAARKSSKAKLSVSDVGEVRIIADETNNALVIVATVQEYDVIERVILQLDVVPLQVLIDATIIEVTLDDRLKYGVEWFLKFGNVQAILSGTRTASGDPGAGSETLPFFNSIADGGLSALVTTSDVRALINVLADDGLMNVISSPSLMVLNNHEGTIRVGDQISLVTSSQTDSTNQNNVTQNFQQVDTGITLTVKPRVNPGGLVIMDIEQRFDNADTTAGVAGENPDIFQRQIESSVAIQSGDTLVLGGLISESENRSETGIPYLKDLPVLGVLFGTTDTRTIRTELVILITPRVVADRRDGLEVTDEFKRRLSTLYDTAPNDPEKYEPNPDMYDAKTTADPAAMP